MLSTILRKEHKNDWERRVALTPEAIEQLIANGHAVDVEQSSIRIFADEQYQAVGASLKTHPDDHQLVIGIKEPPVDSIKAQQVHLAFSHTIKGQDYNMPLLQRFIDQKATLLDYEVMVDESGKRTIAFGVFAGIAGAIDSFWLLGKKLALQSKNSQLNALLQTVEYPSIADIKQAFSSIDLTNDEPIQVVIVGSGNVGQGAEQVCQWLNLPKLDKQDFIKGNNLQGSWYTVLSSPDIHQAIDGSDFDYADYLKFGKEKYRSTFSEHLGKFNLLLQTPYWTDFYPKHLPLEALQTNADKLPLVVGDISCDIDGSLACTKQISSIDQPCFSYYPQTDSIEQGLTPDGVTVMAIDNLPCELSEDASQHFSSILKGYVPSLMQMDLSQDFANLALPEVLKGSMIVYKGELTPKFSYLSQFL